MFLFQLNLTSRKSQKLIPSKKNKSFTTAKISSRKKQKNSYRRFSKINSRESFSATRFSRLSVYRDDGKSGQAKSVIWVGKVARCETQTGYEVNQCEERTF